MVINYTYTHVPSHHRTRRVWMKQTHQKPLPKLHSPQHGELTASFQSLHVRPRPPNPEGGEHLLGKGGRVANWKIRYESSAHPTLRGQFVRYRGTSSKLEDSLRVLCPPNPEGGEHLLGKGGRVANWKIRYESSAHTTLRGQFVRYRGTSSKLE